MRLLAVALLLVSCSTAETPPPHTEASQLPARELQCGGGTEERGGACVCKATEPVAPPDCSECQRELASATEKIETLRREAAALKNGSAELLKSGLLLLANGNESDAAAMLSRVVAEYPASPEVDVASQRLGEIKARRVERENVERAEIEAAERKRQEGFKALKPAKVVKAEQSTVKPQALLATKKWTFDRTPYEYSSREPRKGFKYLTFDFQVTSSASSPVLPVFVAFVRQDDHLRVLGTFQMEFYKWSDYGSYLGNYSDYNNDFAHRSTIRFTAGLEVNEDTLSEPIFVAAWGKSCMFRREDRLKNPQIYYEQSQCGITPTVALDEAERKLTITHVHNAKKL